jgi:hypothetical protein
MVRTSADQPTWSCDCGPTVDLSNTGLLHHVSRTVPGVVERYQQRSVRLTCHVPSVVCKLAGQALDRAPPPGCPIWTWPWQNQ